MTTAKPPAPRRPAPLDYTRPIWKRQSGETEAAYKSFKVYRDMEKRRVRDAPNGNSYSARWSWRERVEAWDKHMADNEAGELVRYRIAMGERHRALGRKALEKAELWLDSLTEDKISRMSANGIVQMMDVAARIEREAAGAGAEPASEGSPMMARTVPTSTVSSSGTRISSRTPDAGEGTSVSTLSVATSSRGSSASTVSPTALSQEETVPSVTDSPRAGIFTDSDIAVFLTLV